MPSFANNTVDALPPFMKTCTHIPASTDWPLLEVALCSRHKLQSLDFDHDFCFSSAVSDLLAFAQCLCEESRRDERKRGNLLNVSRGEKRVIDIGLAVKGGIPSVH